MKSLTTLLAVLGLTLTFTSCNETSLKAGDCIQKPDSLIVWKIIKADKEQLTLEQKQNSQMPQNQEIAANAKGYIKTECL